MAGRARQRSKPSASSATKVVGWYSHTWSELIRRGPDIEVLECHDCAGHLRFVASRLIHTYIPIDSNYVPNRTRVLKFGVLRVVGLTALVVCALL